VDSFGHARLSGIGEALAELIEKKTGFETRSVNLGHTQRGGVPTAYDRILGQRYGLHAIDMVHDKKWGRIAVSRGWTSPTSPSRKPSPPTAASISASST
jgi:6-phosphofructokinase